MRGVDSLDEVALHGVLCRGFEASGLGVLREQPYPGEAGRRPRRTERERCDIVLTEGAGVGVRDPVEVLREADALAGTLFEGAPGPEPAGVDPGEAFWLEVKTVAQTAYVCGVPGPNGSYASRLLGPTVRDLAKLSRDRGVRAGGLLLVVFCTDERTAEHDLAVLLHRCLDRDVPVASPVEERFAIRDRVGNGVCSVSIVPLRAARD